MLGTLIFTGSELWAPFNLPYRTALKGLEVYPSVCYQSDHQRNVCKWSLNFLSSDLMITAIKREQAFRCTSFTITIKVIGKSKYKSLLLSLHAAKWQTAPSKTLLFAGQTAKYAATSSQTIFPYETNMYNLALCTARAQMMLPRPQINYRIYALQKSCDCPINSTYPTICRLIHIPFYFARIWNKINHAPISQGRWMVHRSWEDCCHTTEIKTNFRVTCTLTGN